MSFLEYPQKYILRHVRYRHTGASKRVLWWWGGMDGPMALTIVNDTVTPQRSANGKKQNISYTIYLVFSKETVPLMAD